MEGPLDCALSPITKQRTLSVSTKYPIAHKYAIFNMYSCSLAMPLTRTDPSTWDNILGALTTQQSHQPSASAS